MLRDRSRVDYKMLRLIGERKFKSKSNEELNQSYSLSSVNLLSNQVNSLSNISVSVTQRSLSSSFISSQSRTSADINQTSTHLGIPNPEKTGSSLHHHATSKADDLIVNELSKIFDNCSIKELKMNEDELAVIQQVSAQTAVISYDIDDFIDETPNKEISNSIEDLDATIIKADNYRNQFRSKHQELRNALDNGYEGRCQENLETKLAVIKHYIKEAKCARKNIRNKENLRKVDERSTKARSLDFSFRCMHSHLEN